MSGLYKHALKYGSGHVLVELPERNLLGIIEPKRADGVRDIKMEIERALTNPINSERISKLVGRGDKILVLVSDITRPVPNSVILPPLIEEIKNAGVDLSDVRILIASGAHRKLTNEEKRVLIGEDLLRKITVMDHDCKNSENLLYFGKTTHGTELRLNSLVDLSDFIIGTGCVDIHWFAGYTGGSKIILPGVAAYESIQQNHAMMLLPEARTGCLQGNPVREDIDEAGEIADLDFILNVVLNDRKEIVKAYAGDRVEAHRHAAKLFDTFYKASVSRKADIVIASAGGFPKDINLYQAQKALDNASYAVRDGGILILVAECREGYGEKTFEQWMIDSTPEEIVEKIKAKFILGGHKAYGFAKLLKRLRRVILVSSIDEKLINKKLLTPAKSVQDALNLAFEELGHDSSVLIMPYAGSTFPEVLNNNKN